MGNFCTSFKKLSVSLNSYFGSINSLITLSLENKNIYIYKSLKVICKPCANKVCFLFQHYEVLLWTKTCCSQTLQPRTRKLNILQRYVWKEMMVYFKLGRNMRDIIPSVTQATRKKIAEFLQQKSNL